MTTSYPLSSMTSFGWPPWYVVAINEIGRRHFAEGQRCQDAWVAVPIGSALLLAVSDGVSSEPNSEEGARSILSVATLHLRSALTGGNVRPELLLDALDQAHRALHGLASERGVALQTFAATVAMALITSETIVAASIGDSSVLALTSKSAGGEQKTRASPLCAGKLLPRGTLTLAHIEWRDYVAVASCPTDSVTGVIVASDGADKLYTTGDVTSVSFDTKFIHDIEGGIATLGLRDFGLRFASAAAAQPDGDDRTMILAMKPPAKSWPPGLGHA